MIYAFLPYLHIFGLQLSSSFNSFLHIPSEYRCLSLTFHAMYDFMEPHTATKKVLCELVGQKLELGENRWLGLIKMVSR